MPKVVDVPGVGPTEFPDTMSDDDVSSAIRQQTNWKAPQPQKEPDLLSKALNYQPTPVPKSGNSLIDTVNSLGDTMAGAPLGMAQGAAKQVIGTGMGLAKLFGAKVDPAYEKQLTAPNTLAQHVGSLGATAGELALTGGATGALADAAGLGKVGTAVAQGLGAGAMTEAQTGGNHTAAAINAAMPMAPFVVNSGGKILSRVLGISTGAGEKSIQRAFSNPQSSGLAQAMRGDLSDQDVVDNLTNATKAIRDNAAQEYTNSLANIKSSQLPNNWGKLSQDYVSNLRNKLGNELSNFGVRVVKGRQGPELDFRHSTMGADDQARLQSLFDTIGDWGSDVRDLTPVGLDVLKKKIGANVDGSQLGALSTRLYDTAKNGLNGIVPGYSQMTSQYAQAQDFLNRLKDVGGTPAGPANPGTTVRKLTYLLKSNNNYREDLLKEMGPAGDDLLDQIAGLHLRNFAPRGLSQYLALGAGEGALMLHGNPITAAAGVAASSPRLVGEAARLAGKIPVPPADAATLAAQTATSDLSQ